MASTSTTLFLLLALLRFAIAASSMAPFALLFFASLFSFASSSSPLAIFVFGDSLLDPGNDLKLLTLARADRPPYGRDLPDHLPTGRFSNGLLTSDFIASFAGLPYPPAYLLDEDNIMTGASFASSGAGIMNLTGYQLLQRINFFEQVGFFKDVRQTLVNKLGIEEAGTLVSKGSIMLVCLGNNDYLTNYFGNPFGLSRSQRMYSPQQFCDLLISIYKENLLELYKLGARKFAIVSLSSIGCVPLELLLSSDRYHGSCNDEINDEIKRFNAALKAMIGDLQLIYGDGHFTFLNSFDTVYGIIRNPTVHGFLYGSEACCGAGPHRAIPCYRAISSACENASQYVFWDFAHPTQALNMVLAQKFWNGSWPDVSPMNIQQLFSL